MTSSLLARVALSRVLEPGEPKALALVAELGPEVVLEALHEQAQRPGASEGLVGRLAGIEPARDLERAAALGVRFVTPEDPEWPMALADLAFAGETMQRGQVPVGLWVRGAGNLSELCTRAVAIVGSRSCSVAGADTAAQLSFSVAKQGWTVVSGAAFGIDQAAHRGCLAAKHPTVAVLACGLDRAYPASAAPLLDVIAAEGVVVSESPPGEHPTPIRFLARNRIIAALGAGTVVVEAAIRSGALNTATWADRMSRMLMGVPGPVTSAPSTGVHQMIRQRGALLVTSGEEVLEAISPSGDHAQGTLWEPVKARDRLSIAHQQVLDAVPVVQAVEAPRLARTAGMSLGVVKEALAVLEGQGFVVRQGERWRLADSA